MKCVENNSTRKVRRLSDLEAALLVASGKYHYVSKAMWKANRSAKQVADNNRSKPE